MGTFLPKTVSLVQIHWSDFQKQKKQQQTQIIARLFTLQNT